MIVSIPYPTEYNGRDVHILGLFIDYKTPVFQEYLTRFQQSRTNRNYKLCANLQSAGIPITYEMLVDSFPNAVITRAHYASYLLEKGYVKSRNEAFDRYLGDHTPYFVHREKITPEEVIEVTLKAMKIRTATWQQMIFFCKCSHLSLVRRRKRAINTLHCHQSSIF